MERVQLLDSPHGIYVAVKGDILILGMMGGDAGGHYPDTERDALIDALQRAKAIQEEHRTARP